MKFSILTTLAIAATAVAQPLLFKRDNTTERANVTATHIEQDESDNNDLQTSYGSHYALFQPKVVVISMFELERDPWLELLDFKHNITLPGLSPIYPTVHCTTNYSICQVTTGEGEINAAASITALSLSPLFDLTKTYFLIAGIAGGMPEYTTLGGVTFAKYAVQVGLEYQIDPREVEKTNPDWNTGYFAYGTKNPFTYPKNVYGTEVFEWNEKLRDRAVDLASKVELDKGTKQNAKFRALYKEEAAKKEPFIAKCDVLTSDNYFSGPLLDEYFSNFTKLMTNGSGIYCSTAQEDNASLEALTRMDQYGLVDYERIVVMRTISDFAVPPPSMANNTVKFFTEADQGGIGASLTNLVKAGLPFVHDVIENWDDVYEKGTKYVPDNYIGDIYGTLGGTPDFGKESFGVA